MQRWFAALESREAQLRLERARRIPNPTLAFGVRMEGQPERVTRGLAWSTGDIGVTRSVSNPSRDFETSVMFEVSMPLPVFSRNQGKIAEAQYAVEQVADARRAARVALERELRMAYTRLETSHKALGRLDTEILPRAEETFALTEEGYRQGKFGYLDVLEAQRTLFDLRTQRLDAAAAFHLASVDIERLTGTEAIVEIWFGSAEPESLFRWLERLETAHGIQATRAFLDRAEGDAISGRITVERIE